jgi:septal ring factor EnvC (AmiA/AmiB activator)
MLDILTIATWAGAFMTIIGLISFLISPILKSFAKINQTLTQTSHNLELITRDLEASKSDRVAIHNELREHDKRLDAQKEKLIEHGQQLRTLFKERGN